MKGTCIIFIFTFMLYIRSTSSLIVSHEQHEEKLTDIPARSEDNRMLEGKALGNSAEHANTAQIYYPFVINPDNGTFIKLGCRGVLIASKWVVTVAHCFDVVILSKTDRRRFSNFVMHFKQITEEDLYQYKAWVVVGRNDSHSNNVWMEIDKVFIHDRYDIRYDPINDVDVALIELRDAVPKHVAAPPPRIYDYLEADSSRMYPHTQDCWVVSDMNRVQREELIWGIVPLHKMKVIVGNGKYCSVLEAKLYRGKKHLKYNEEYLCAKTNESVNPGARLCTGDDGAAMFCKNGWLLGLLSRLHESGKCEGENAYGKYVYLGNRHVYEWMKGIVSGTIHSDDVLKYRSGGSDESASGLVEASKAVTWVMTLISVAGTLNTYH